MPTTTVAQAPKPLAEVISTQPPVPAPAPTPVSTVSPPAPPKVESAPRHRARKVAKPIAKPKTPPGPIPPKPDHGDVTDRIEPGSGSRPLAGVVIVSEDAEPGASKPSRGGPKADPNEGSAPHTQTLPARKP